MTGRILDMSKRKYAKKAGADKLAHMLEESLPAYECIKMISCLKAKGSHTETNGLSWEAVLQEKETKSWLSLGSYDRLSDCLIFGYKLQYDDPNAKLERDVMVIALGKVMIK